MSELQKIVNIGPKLAEQLQEVGISSIDELTAVGSREAWSRILATDSSACIMRLYALEGAIRDIRWKYLDAEIKADLKYYYNIAKGKA